MKEPGIVIQSNIYRIELPVPIKWYKRILLILIKFIFVLFNVNTKKLLEKDLSDEQINSNVDEQNMSDVKNDNTT
ncbi:MAG TPA: hypothetical protein PLI27_06570 [Ignavibacteriales bacterium]|nr:hypothetical protein [Ignavibacteriales bacterium]HOL81359.1 hypothetical protein [Ignavibacteriales bacterium]HOM65475.1 hypothetical protein [Ignavibacteriales bacterium]HPD67721.1 hypothetical protein [Ignavibacteriales bacterium]HPP33872.1 hypothetical protein [Ignavibacteriales bacterium]